ncbi:hypothetical protein B0H12DRAFT_1240372 [Mycena haematopus]|nr:hypothetical protein B0H12DRAFT_1240372 [Mycena haematopus]
MYRVIGAYSVSLLRPRSVPPSRSPRAAFLARSPVLILSSHLTSIAPTSPRTLSRPTAGLRESPPPRQARMSRRMGAHDKRLVLSGTLLLHPILSAPDAYGHRRAVHSRVAQPFAPAATTVASTGLQLGELSSPLCDTAVQVLAARFTHPINIALSVQLTSTALVRTSPVLSACIPIVAATVGTTPDGDVAALPDGERAWAKATRIL